MYHHLSKFFPWLVFSNLLILLILPQLNNVHYDPLPQFWAETTFAWASISLFLITCFCLNDIYIPRIVIPLALFAIYIAGQNLLVTIDFIGLSYVASLEIVICIFLAISIASLHKQLGIEMLVSMLCLSFVTGSIAQSVIGLLQYTGLYTYFGSLIFYDASHPTTNIFGHFGQRNHYCHYLSWGIFSLIYLYNKQKIKLPLFLFLMGWLLFSMTIAGSRSVFIYFASATIISFIYAIYNRDRNTLKLFSLIFATSIVLISFEYLYPIVFKLFSHGNQINSGLQRIITDSGDSGLAGRRLVEWQKAWLVFKHYPIFGYGWNEFAKQSVFLQPLFPNAPLNSGLFTNCHNVVLQLLAETGIVGTCIIGLGSLYALYTIAKQNSTEVIIILCMLFTTIDHSMVEYPLWYIYFLGPCIIFLAIDKPLFKLPSNWVAGISILPLSLIVYLLFRGSFIFNTLVNYIDAPSNQKAFTSQAKYLENIMNTNVLWGYPTSYTLDSYINVDTPNTNMTFDIPTQLKYENKLTDFHPYPDNMISQAKLNWRLGNKDLARKYVKLALVSFPVYKPSYLSELKDSRYKELYNIVDKYQYSSKAK